MSYCKVSILANLTRDPEITATPSGKSVCKFSVAVNERRKGANGEAIESVSFIDCQAWEKTAELISKYYTKGKPIHLFGRIKQESWEDKTSGQKRSKLVVIVEALEFLPRNSAEQDDNSGGGDSQPEVPRNAPPPRQPQQRNLNDIDEDVPF